MHEDSITKSKRVTDVLGAIVSTIELDVSNFSNNDAFQPKKFTSYERDANGSDEAMFRRYNRWQSRFDQPDPYDGSYSLTNPQSFNRYAYVQGDPVNFTDPSGLFGCINCPDDDDGGGYPSWWDGWDARNGGPDLTPPGDYPRDDPSRGGGSPQKPSPAVTNLVNTTLSSKDCQEFMNTILNNASSKGNPVLEGGDIQRIFADFIAQTKGGVSRQRLTKYGSAGGRIGTNGSGNGTLYLPLYSDPTVNQDLLDASGIVNELPHIAGSKGGWPDREEYDDYALANATHNSKFDAFSKLSSRDNPFTAGETNRYSGRWSSYFHDILRQMCVIPK